MRMTERRFKASTRSDAEVGGGTAAGLVLVLELALKSVLWLVLVLLCHSSGAVEWGSGDGYGRR